MSNHPNAVYIEFLNGRTICTNVPNMNDFTIAHYDGCIGEGDQTQYQFWTTDGNSHLMHCTIVEGLVEHGQHRDAVHGYDYVMNDHTPPNQNTEQ